MSEIATLEEARTEIFEIKEIVADQAKETGMGFLTNCGPGIGLNGLCVWGNRGEEVWITASRQSADRKLSDEEAADLLFRQGVKFMRPGGSAKWVSVDEEDTVDDVLTNIAATSTDQKRQ